MNIISGQDMTKLARIACYTDISSQKLRSLTERIKDEKAKTLAQLIWADKEELRRQPKEIKEAVKALKSWARRQTRKAGKCPTCHRSYRN